MRATHMKSTSSCENFVGHWRVSLQLPVPSRDVACRGIESCDYRGSTSGSSERRPSCIGPSAKMGYRAELEFTGSLGGLFPFVSPLV